MKNEIWKDIKGFENIYQISNYGRIKTLPRKINKGKCHLDILEGIKIQTFNPYNGYCSVTLSLDGKNKRAYTHRLVALHFLENYENKKEVNHIDGDKTNNNVLNLEWNTREQNIQHAYKNGLIKKRYGIENHTFVLTMEQIKYIKNNCIFRNKEWGIRGLAEKLGVCRSTVSRAWHMELDEELCQQ